MVVRVERPVTDISPVNVTPALVIVQSFVHVKVPDVSGDAAVQLHSTDVTRSKYAASATAKRK